jgi:hypothetical protein
LIQPFDIIQLRTETPGVLKSMLSQERRGSANLGHSSVNLALGS